MNHENAILSVRDIHYEIDTRALLKGISLDIPRGSFVGIIGPNGSGKSTLLKTIYRTMKAKSGSVYLNGTEMARLSSRDIARQMAVVAQENSVSFDFSVMEMMRIGLYAKRTLFDRNSADDTRICEEALQSVGMLSFKNRSFLSLSGGEKQKVLIASAFSRNPELIVLDEPTNHLDIGYQFLILDLMKSRSDVTIFTSIHDMNLAMRYCDHIIAIQDGAVYCTGTPREVLTPEHLGQLFRVRAEIEERPGEVPYIRYLGALTEETSL
ncbi:MAG: ABC transporter ATP-binding protein [Oscillospiraceae bacterium]|nr:ABC transporter ATP-binding protein [Oscillospiraceae bacterium]